MLVGRLRCIWCAEYVRLRIIGVKNGLPHQVAILRSPVRHLKNDYRDKRTGEKAVIHRNPTVVTQTFWYTGCRYLNLGNKTANINVKNYSLSISYNGEMTHRKRQK